MSMSYNSVYFNNIETTVISFNVVRTCTEIIHKILPDTYHTPLTPHKNLHKHNFTHTHIHKRPPHTSHTPLNCHKNLHTKILPDTHVNKILHKSHNTPLHPHKFLHTVLLTHRTFACTRKNL